MFRYLKQRLYLFIPTLIGTTLLAFILGHITSADPALVILTMDGMSAPSAADVAAKRVELGLDAPLFIQYMRWSYHVLLGDWGRSYVTNLPVLNTLWTAAQVTLQLGGLSFVMVVLSSITLGVTMTLLRRHWIGESLNTLSILYTSVPLFWVAIIALQIGSENLHIFPTSGYQTWWHFMLPAIILGIPSTGLIMRVQRDALTQVLEEQYFLMARAKGFPKLYAVYRHGLKNSCIAVATLLGNYLLAILGGSALVEIIFGLPGLGMVVYEAIRARDYPMIQGYVVMVGALTISINIGVDVLYLWLNPKIRKGAYRES